MDGEYTNALGTFFVSQRTVSIQISNNNSTFPFASFFLFMIIFTA